MSFSWRRISAFQKFVNSPPQAAVNSLVFFHYVHFTLQTQQAALLAVQPPLLSDGAQRLLKLLLGVREVVWICNVK